MGRIRTVAASHSHARSEPHQLMAMSDPEIEPPNLMVPSRIRFHCTTTGTPRAFLIDRVTLLIEDAHM